MQLAYSKAIIYIEPAGVDLKKTDSPLIIFIVLMLYYIRRK